MEKIDKIEKLDWQNCQMKKKNNRKVEPRDAIGLRLQKVVLLICIKK